MHELSTEERAILAHVVVSPDEWWAHVNTITKMDAEAALAAKIKRWRPEYDAAIAAGDYKTRADRMIVK